MRTDGQEATVSVLTGARRENPPAGKGAETQGQVGRAVKR